MSDELPDLSKVPPEDRDRVWFERYYQGDNVPQLTLRAVVMGGLIGMAMSVSRRVAACCVIRRRSS